MPSTVKSNCTVIETDSPSTNFLLESSSCMLHVLSCFEFDLQNDKINKNPSQCNKTEIHQIPVDNVHENKETQLMGFIY